jgi:hypothetical protein
MMTVDRKTERISRMTLGSYRRKPKGVKEMRAEIRNIVIVVTFGVGASIVLASCGSGASVKTPRTSTTMQYELPILPSRGIAVSNAAASRLLDLSGSTLVRLPRLTLMSAPPGVLVFVSKGGSLLWSLEVRRHRLVGVPSKQGSKAVGSASMRVERTSLPRGCFSIARRYSTTYAKCVSGRFKGAILGVDESGASRVLVRASSDDQAWWSIELSPRGETLLGTLLSSGKCAAEKAFVIPVSGRSVRSIRGRSLGFTSDGQPLVFKTRKTGCNLTGDVITISPVGERVIVSRVRNAAMWGDAGKKLGD